MKSYKTQIFAPLFLFLFMGMSKMEAGWLVKEEFLSLEVEQFDCHSSSIAETSSGKYCVVWKGGPGNGKSNIDMTKRVGLWLSLFDGNVWSAPREIVGSPKSVCWTPVLSHNLLGELLLFYRVGPEPRRVVSFLKRSLDGGLNWSESEILPAGIVGPTKNKPVIGNSGALISPSSVEAGAPQDPFHATACWIEISEDNGAHWKKIGPIELPNRKFGVIEPALFLDQEGKLRMLCRDRANRIGEIGYIWTAVSEDEGLNWSELKQTPLPNPDAAIDVVDLGKGRIVLIYNHSHRDRHPLNLAVSLDGGETWSEPLVLDKIGEFPSGILSSDGFLHITYAFTNQDTGQRRIKYAIVDPIELMKEAQFN